MIRSQEEDFVAVRVQDPRVQNPGSWTSFVDYKIFLHTNSRAFTAKTSCVRRRYSEFVWLKKMMQKNAGLVPVPELPGKSFFFFSNEDFLERRRKGLQTFLEKVVHTTVCLSDSQLHLFLQTQLPVTHIQDCVQGHTPYSVTDAILTYASSNRGFAQAQGEEPNVQPSLTVSYESMESPAPHQPSSPANKSFSSLLPETQAARETSVWIQQKSLYLEAVLEDQSPSEVRFFLSDEESERSSRMETPVMVHTEHCEHSGENLDHHISSEETPELRSETLSLPHDEDLQSSMESIVKVSDEEESEDHGGSVRISNGLEEQETSMGKFSDQEKNAAPHDIMGLRKCSLSNVNRNGDISILESSSGRSQTSDPVYLLSSGGAPADV